MKYPNYNPQFLEPEVLAYWKEAQIVEKLRKITSKGPKFYFLDGPPYTSGKFHLGHAWNYSLKDFILRYKRSRGYHLWDRNGFDMHGLPTEHKVMAKHNLKTKEDILNFGLDKFTQECESFSKEMAQIMTQDLIRMGVTFDVSNPYMPIKPEFIEGEWQLIKKAFEEDHLYYGEKVLTWCQHCETAVAKHECEYKTVVDDSIFVKFPLKSKKKEFLIIWTTTPWTIPFNLAVMVNPNLEYVKVDVGGEKWILAKALAGIVVQAVAGRKMGKIEEMKGTDLEGLEYIHPFESYLPQFAALKKKHKNVHTVILSEDYVDTSAGTGLVHSAPGCGPEDQEACKPYRIPPFNTLSENGFFSSEMGKFAGMRAKVDDQKFIQALEDEGVLIKVNGVEHEYPFCWRCHKPVIFRITYQWFFKIEDLREKILIGNKKVDWVPDTAKNAYESWVKNLKDNSISRQRYWGTPLPIWKCTNKKCNEIKVIGSRKEIEDNGGKVPENLHIPWIDKVELKCKKCSSTMQRLSDVIDVWVDSGTTSWNCLNNDPKLIKEWYPADAILEAKEQTRLWFSMLSIASYLFRGDNCFKNVYVYGMLNDLNGQKMSKSLGNIISPYELINKHGVDVLRYYMCQNNAGEDINFSWEEAATKSRYLQILWNVHKLLLNLAKENELNPYTLNSERMHNLMGWEEKYIISKLHSTIEKVTALFENYNLDKIILPLEELYLELSRTYIQMVRDKSSSGEESEKEVCVYTIGYVLMEFLKMFNIVAPFISEAIYLNLKEEFRLGEESISHFKWPVFDPKKINLDLEREMELAQNIIQAALNAREKVKIGVRWPLQEMFLASKEKDVSSTLSHLKEIIAKLVNVRSIKLIEKLPGVKLKIRPDFKRIGPIYGELSSHILVKLTTDSAETILRHLDEESAYHFTLEGKEVRITRDMIILEREIPENYTAGEFRGGMIYLNLIRDLELESEGYAREIMRNLQEMRKKAGLQKVDRVIMFLKADAEMVKRLEPFKEDIEIKVGINDLEISTVTPLRNYQWNGEFKIKQESFNAWMEKV